jgi:hypothetical protein
MNSDIIMMLVRYGLIAGGTYMASKGWLKADDVTTTADTVQTAIGSLVAVATTIWGGYIVTGTKRVPISTADRKDVPTVSPVTGQQIPGRVRDHL